jgi:1-acyl-sn-glycerol-3-phosphate acyltransferase
MSVAKPVNAVLRWFFGLLCRIPVQEFQKFPTCGPLILVGNHINFLEAPVLFPHLDNPQVVALAKRETWKNPLFNFLFNLWHIIPIDRGLVDREAFRLCLEALEQGRILVVSPEGTRSKDGQLLQGKPGVLALALRSGAPLFPAAFYGHENFWDNLKHLRRTPLNVAVGQPFRLDPQAGCDGREVRQAVTDEIMCKIAELMPDPYRGYYREAAKAPYRFLIPVEGRETGQ